MTALNLVPSTLTSIQKGTNYIREGFAMKFTDFTGARQGPGAQKKWEFSFSADVVRPSSSL